MRRDTRILSLLVGLASLYASPETLNGRLKTGVYSAGGDCGHRWWLQLDSPGKRRGEIVALEPEISVPPGLKDDHVQVEGQLKICHGVEGGHFKVIVIESIKPIPKY